MSAAFRQQVMHKRFCLFSPSGSKQFTILQLWTSERISGTGSTVVLPVLATLSKSEAG